MLLRRAVRKDCGQISLDPALAEPLRAQYQQHSDWSYQLHYDNLAARMKSEPTLGPLPSYSTIRRYMQAHGMVRQPKPKGRPGEQRAAFRLETNRRQRRSDGTISLEGKRFEIPGRYRHFRDVTVRYTRWDLGRVDLVDPRSGTILSPIYPLDRIANADGRRSALEPISPEPSAGGDSPASGELPANGELPASGELPPLLKKILEDYSATGLPPAYLPKDEHHTQGDA